MMEHQKKIHPVDVESQQRPTAPLVPRSASRSDKGDPAAANSQQPPFRRTIPVSHYPPPPRHGSRRGCFCRCVCWSICFLFLLLVLVVATAGALYLIYRPKIPSYSVDRLRISSFSIDPSFNVNAGFDVTITATNPNNNIGIYYGDGSYLSVSYDGSRLCDGKLPAFYQGHRNTTVLTVVLSGRTQIGSDVSNALQVAQQTGAVPLDFDGYVPVNVKLGALKLMKVKFLVRCKVVVNSLNVDNQISIRSSSCSFKLRL